MPNTHRRAWRASPSFLIITARPDFSPPWPTHRHVSVMALGRPGQREGAALAHRVAKGKALRIAAVGNQASGGHEVAFKIDRRQPVLRRQLDVPFTMRLR
jgi:hypothetical protein